MYKTKFLKKRVEMDYTPAADGTYSWQLTDQALAAIWITVKGDLVAADQCNNDLLNLIDGLDVWFGGFNVVHYTHGEHAHMMNMLLKQNRSTLIGNGQAIDDIQGVSFPILFGAPYINEAMALPASLSNRKTLSLTVDIADAAFDALMFDIAEVVLPNAHPRGFIKQEESTQIAGATGDADIWMQRNWDLLKLLLHAPTAPCDATWTQTINRAGMEIDDFAFGYQNVPWTILHGELMDELGGMSGIENHTHTTLVPDETGMPSDLEHWIRYYAVMDFFHNKDLKWAAPLSTASTAKIKINKGVAEAWTTVQANYVPTAKVS